MRTIQGRSAQRGISLIEVMVTILVLSIGLLGMAGLQSKLQLSEMEAYQRSQALLLLQDISSRLASNKTAAADYVTGADSPIGPDTDCDVLKASASYPDQDLGEWCLALKGASEVVDDKGTVGTADDVVAGAVEGGRGCIEQSPSDPRLYMVTIAWQGLVPLNAPPASVACGKDDYDKASGACTADRCRRVITTLVRVPNL